MNVEFELRILNIDKGAIVKKLESIGAHKVHDEVLQRRYIMDFPDNRLWKKGGWIRLRKAGDLRVELSFKKRSHPHTIDSAKETYLEISDFDTAHELLKQIGLEDKRYQENKRMRYKKNNVVFDIDTWPGKNTYMEIESNNEKNVWSAVDELGFTKEECTFTAGPDLMALLGFSEEQQKNIRF